MITKESIEGYLEQIITDPQYFVVAVKVSASKIRRKITVLLDSDGGILIDECARISRELATELDEVIEDAYTLEVSSPGVDFPMTTSRQFKRVLGKDIKVVFENGESIIGNLVDVTGDEFTFLPEKKKKEKKAPSAEKINLKDIKEAIVQVSFK